MNLQKIVITLPTFFQGEGTRINQLFEEGIYRLHLRKPNSTIKDMERLIQDIHPKYYPQISLHDHFELAIIYHLGGIHLNRRHSMIPEGFTGLISQSCHSLEEVLAVKATRDYVFLSPIFDSISKKGYPSQFSHSQLVEASLTGVIDNKVFALGGINEQTILELHDTHFGGVVMLGAVW